MPLKPHPTDPDKMVYVSRQYDLPDATMQSLKDLNRTVCDEVGRAAFAQPPQRTWVGLTDEERRVCTQSPFTAENYRAIEAKLKEKNDR